MICLCGVSLPTMSSAAQMLMYTLHAHNQASQNLAQVTPEKIAFMVNYTSGLICVPMPKERLDELGLPLMVDSAENEEALRTAFTVTVDARDGITTGISAEDRSCTIRLMADPATEAAELRKPGHILPLV